MREYFFQTSYKSLQVYFYSEQKRTEISKFLEGRNLVCSNVKHILGSGFKQAEQLEWTFNKIYNLQFTVQCKMICLIDTCTVKGIPVCVLNIECVLYMCTYSCWSLFWSSLALKRVRLHFSSEFLCPNCPFRGQKKEGLGGVFFTAQIHWLPMICLGFP